MYWHFLAGVPLLICVATSSPILTVVTASRGANASSFVSRACKVFCEGPLLDAVQRARLFNDSKTFVDMPLKASPEYVLDAFAKLQTPHDRNVLISFVNAHFDAEGHELRSHTPQDYQEAPAQLTAIKNAEARSWALGLNRLWKNLCRVQIPEVAAAPERYSALPQRFPMVVPGGRFRETYYWDTYWIVRGLLISDMVLTARGVVENLLDYVRSFGFVPNGGRIYYLDRSQPPLLVEMVLAVYAARPDPSWLRDVLDVLTTEYRFWMDPQQGHLVSIPTERLADRSLLTLNVYHSSQRLPRPESYAEDFNTASRGQTQYNRSREDVYQGIRAAAESGWDFSSRWLKVERSEPLDLATVDASDVVPVDLNCVLYRVELGLARIHQILFAAATTNRLHDQAAAANYTKAAKNRAEAMNNLLWMDSLGTYRDYRIAERKWSEVTALSDFAAPLWAGLTGPNKSDRAGVPVIVDSLQKSGLLQSGGGATTNLRTGQQWDAPNAWAPIQLMLVEGLDGFSFHSKSTQVLANDLATKWLHNCFMVWTSKGVMAEKYDAFNPGASGGGGEYRPQVGFGWSNGVALALLIRNTSVILPSQSGEQKRPLFA